MNMRSWAVGVGVATTACCVLALCFAACGGGDGHGSKADSGSDLASDAAVALDASMSLDAAIALTPKQACEAYLDAACTRAHECGKPLNCESLKPFCPDNYLGVGTSRTKEELLACAEARLSQSCQDIQNGIDLPCVLNGTLAGGEACHFSPQCRSGSCSSDNHGGCGTCVAFAANGTHCDSENLCDVNVDCVAQICMPRGVPTALPVGSACNAQSSCPEAAPCIVASAGADTGTCTPIPGEGQPCGFFPGAPSATVCAPPTRCVRPGPSSPTGTCSHIPRPVGGLCGSAIGAACEVGAFCNDTQSGTCELLHTVGQPCQSTDQCTSKLFCSDALSCAPRVDAGMPCTTLEQCQPGQDCVVTSAGDAGVGLCIDVAGIGEPCGGPNQACAGALLCVGGTCTLGVCPMGG